MILRQENIKKQRTFYLKDKRKEPWAIQLQLLNKINHNLYFLMP